MTQAQLPKKDLTVAFIGAGNMARSLIAGLVEDKTPLHIRVADPDQAQLDMIRRHWPSIQVDTDNAAMMAGADFVVLAVKPQVMRSVLEPLREQAQRQRPVFISVAAGIREGALNTWLGGGLPVVRCMPNTPALVQAVRPACMPMRRCPLPSAVWPRVSCVRWALPCGLRMRTSWMR
ncbi:MAG: NAD(P)-binding domain-containing protein [Thiolinea sp.]